MFDSFPAQIKEELQSEVLFSAPEAEYMSVQDESVINMPRLREALTPSLAVPDCPV